MQCRYIVFTPGVLSCQLIFSNIFNYFHAPLPPGQRLFIRRLVKCASDGDIIRSKERSSKPATKSEIRNPEIRNPHPVPHSAPWLRDAEAPVAPVLSAEPMLERFAISAFGFRISDFLRISGLRPSDFPRAFGFQISAFGPGSGQAFDSPTSPVLAADKLVGLVEVELELGSVPIECGSRKAGGDATQEDRFGQGPGIRKRG